MSRIIFVPVCEKCGYEFEKLEFSLDTRIQCPKCGEILDNFVIPKYDVMIHMNAKDTGYVATYSKDDYY